MAVTAHHNGRKAAVDYFRDWEITPAGRFKNRVTKVELSRQDWEVEMSYEHMDNEDALVLAKALADQAATLDPIKS